MKKRLILNDDIKYKIILIYGKYQEVVYYKSKKISNKKIIIIK